MISKGFVSVCEVWTKRSLDPITQSKQCVHQVRAPLRNPLLSNE
jgi:hypothetical protein